MEALQTLQERIRAEAVYLGRGIIKVDSFLNHQIDPVLTRAMGEAFAACLYEAGVRDVTKVVTAEVSGIAPAVAAGQALGVPVVYARKHRPITMPDGFFHAEAPSHTKGGVVRLMVSPEYLGPRDRVVLIDDFLASGQTIAALAGIIDQSGATLCAIGCVIEKVYEPGREALAFLDVPVITLAKVDLDGDQVLVR
jgi:xanthine phosphoribosyltransferase